MNLTYSFHSAIYQCEAAIQSRMGRHFMNDREKIRLTEMVSGAG